MIYIFIDTVKREKWGTFNKKEEALDFLSYIKTLKGYTDFSILRYTDNMELSAVIPITKELKEI